ncbi:MAG TPA: crossover junction endodeoxyribonuclease RuvC [Myxococcota bacterium]|nr:crossover junction endodeoxyribonuclease RuvC [Myxococcota bacterium]
MRILGIDPGSNVTGYGVIERDGGRIRHVAHGTLGLARGVPLASRLAALHAALGEVIRDHAPDGAVVEQVFVSANARSALVLGEARGVILAAIAGAGVPLFEYGTRTIKLAVTGSGAAPKPELQRMVCALLALEALPAADAADALAAAICHLRGAGLPGGARRRRVRGGARRTGRFVARLG